jgi:hypothetical protein
MLELHRATIARQKAGLATEKLPPEREHLLTMLGVGKGVGLSAKAHSMHLLLDAIVEGINRAATNARVMLEANQPV